LEVSPGIYMDDFDPLIFVDGTFASLRFFQSEKNALTGMFAAKLVRPSKRCHVADVNDFRSGFPMTTRRGEQENRGEEQKTELANGKLQVASCKLEIRIGQFSVPCMIAAKERKGMQSFVFFALFRGY